MPTEKSISSSTPPLLSFPATSQRPGAYISEHPSPHVQVLVLAMCSVLWSKYLENRPIAAKVVVGLASQGILVPDIERKEEKRHSLEKMAAGEHALDPAHSWFYGEKRLGKTPGLFRALRQNPSSMGLGAKVGNAVDAGAQGLCFVSTLTAWLLFVCMFLSPSGLFITIHDKGHLATMLNSWPEDNIKVWTYFYCYCHLYWCYFYLWNEPLWHRRQDTSRPSQALITHQLEPPQMHHRRDLP